MENAREILCDAGYEDAVVFDGPDFDSAIIGVSEDGRVVYDYRKMIEHMMNDDSFVGMTEDEAIEYIEYNTIRALPYTENAPIIIHRLENLC